MSGRTTGAIAWKIDAEGHGYALFPSTRVVTVEKDVNPNMLAHQPRDITQAYVQRADGKVDLVEKRLVRVAV